MAVDGAEFMANVVLQWREKQLQAQIVKTAGELGWKAYHSYFSDRSEAGWPDLVLVRERVVSPSSRRCMAF